MQRKGSIETKSKITKNCMHFKFNFESSDKEKIIFLGYYLLDMFSSVKVQNQKA